MKSVRKRPVKMKRESSFMNRYKHYNAEYGTPFEEDEEDDAIDDSDEDDFSLEEIDQMGGDGNIDTEDLNDYGTDETSEDKLVKVTITVPETLVAVLGKIVDAVDGAIETEEIHADEDVDDIEDEAEVPEDDGADEVEEEPEDEPQDEIEDEDTFEEDEEVEFDGSTSAPSRRVFKGEIKNKGVVDSMFSDEYLASGEADVVDYDNGAPRRSKMRMDNMNRGGEVKTSYSGRTPVSIFNAR